MLEAHLKKHLISPDAFAMKDGKSRWVDFKAKATWTPRRINDDEPQTGIAVRHYQNYTVVENTAGFPCWLAFLHADEPVMLMQTLSLLVPDHYHSTGGRMNYPTVYFNLHNFIAVDLPDSKLTRQFIVAAQKSLDKSVEERIWYLKKNRILKARDVRNGNRWLPWHFNADGSPKEASNAVQISLSPDRHNRA